MIGEQTIISDTKFEQENKSTDLTTLLKSQLTNTQGYEDNIEYPVLRKFNVLEDFDMMVEEYFNWKILSGGAKSTERTYKAVLNKLRKYLIQDNDFITAYNHMQSENMRRNLSPNYCGLCSIIVRDFSKHFKLHYEDYIPRFKKHHKEPVSINPKEFDLILENTKDKIIKKFWIVLYTRGLRLTEALDLKVEDIDFNEHLIRVMHGKGDKMRSVVVPEITLQVLKEHITETNNLRKELDDDNKLVFIHRAKYNGNGVSGYSQRWIQRAFKEAKELSGIKKKATVHSLRHGYATNLLNDGVNIRVIQGQLGHTSLSTTQVYLNVSKNRVKKELKKGHNSFDRIKDDSLNIIPKTEDNSTNSNTDVNIESLLQEVEKLKKENKKLKSELKQDNPISKVNVNKKTSNTYLKEYHYYEPMKLKGKTYYYLYNVKDDKKTFYGKYRSESVVQAVMREMVKVNWDKNELESINDKILWG